MSSQQHHVSMHARETHAAPSLPRVTPPVAPGVPGNGGSSGGTAKRTFTATLGSRPPFVGGQYSFAIMQLSTRTGTYSSQMAAACKTHGAGLALRACDFPRRIQTTLSGLPCFPPRQASRPIQVTSATRALPGVA